MSEPILTAVCYEPEGRIERSVYPMQLTVENLRIFWEKTKDFRYLFDQSINGDFHKFCELFLHKGPNGEIQTNGLFWVVDDFVGVFYMTKIQPGIDAEVHYTFFDRRHRGRRELAKEMLKYVFRKYNFRRLSVEIPLYARPQTFNFIVGLGFRAEGRLRKRMFHSADPTRPGEWFDTKLFGILKEEALNGGR